jgi:RHS repeat-associated protein
MTSVTLPGGGGTVTFAYDPFGRRIKKVTSTTTSVFAYDGDNLIEETNSSGAVVARYSQTQNIDEPLAMLRSAATSYYHADGLGSISSLSNAAGSIANTYTYDSFGKLTASTGSLVNPFQYTARESDTETGLYYYRARYYDPQSGRFISEDPLGTDAGPSGYLFVGNAPINFVDPLGLYKLQNFPPGLQADMKQAIKDAISKLKACPSCAGDDGAKIANTIQHTTFVYVPDLRSPKFRIGDEEFGGGLTCADSDPKVPPAKPTRIVHIGSLAWSPSDCCSLASTVAHEASHKSPTNYNHDQTDDMEEKCFGCTIKHGLHGKPF